MVDKFNTAWQIVRLRAQQIKDYETKLNFVLLYLYAHPNRHNYGRVHNWLVMTAAGYKDQKIKKVFCSQAKEIEVSKQLYSSETDNDCSLKELSNNFLKQLYSNLKKRKYNFQFKSVPEAHTRYLGELEAELNQRGINKMLLKEAQKKFIPSGRTNGFK
jgi:tRNA G18 (ribose-2'-O)-methylase SpoU